jgi:ABC-type multidrug transport system ATPase subunit
VDVGGIPAVDGLSMASTGDHLLVLGAARALFETAAGLRASARGELLVADRDPLEAVRAGSLAGASLDPPLPSSWTIRRYVTWSARLAGHRAATSSELADEAIDRLKLGTAADDALGKVAAAARRGTVIAAALATGAAVLLIEDPIAGLPADVGRPFARIVVRALADRRTAFFAPRVSLDSPFALAADEAIVVDGSQVVAQGDPAELAAGEGTFLVRVVGDAEAFVEAMTGQGGRLLGDGAARARACLTIDLGALSTLDVLRIAEASHAVVVELRPLARVFA